MKNLIRLICLFISFNIFAQPGIASPYKYVNDNSTTNDVYTTAVGDNANNGSQSAPYATLSYAISQAAEGETIYVDAGNYAEQVIINKGISIIGAGQFLTFFSPPATTLIPAPGPFTEIGLFETTQGIGDVHISNLTINSNNASQNIIIQGGGSVTNCILANGFQGIFFRVESGAKTALIENNSIQPVGIGINCQGSGLTALIRNNRIIGPPNSYYAGIFAGLDFGPLPQLTIQNNIIENYSGEGILAASFNGTYTLNSIIGTGTNAINRNGNGGNTPIATCNWFGTSNAATVASKIIGTVIYTPFLTDGTDNSSNVGFQPNAGACATGTLYYVNDGIITGDIFTTAPGNDGNAGTPSAPFATLQHAVNTAAANDIIYVDAGNYAEQVIINKGITIRGAGAGITIIERPATALIENPGTSRSGVISTLADIGELFIKNLTIKSQSNLTSTNYGYAIVSQAGGVISDCEIIGGNLGEGLYFTNSGTNPITVSVINNNIHNIFFLAVNFQGPKISAVVNNNIIDVTGSAFGMGVLGGGEPVLIDGFIVTGNIIKGFNGFGVKVTSNNPAGVVVSNNSFQGIAATQPNIQNNSASPINATCNWYGSADGAVVRAKITNGVNYTPWLTNGTDNNAAVGFQPIEETCNGYSKLYVNDGSTSGDIYTTAIGNNSNTGIASAPFATIEYALSKTQTGDTIIIDAGSYTEIVNVTKDVNLRGAGMGATILNGPAGPVTPFAGTFETGIIQSIAGVTNVIIENMTIDGTVSDEAHGTFIQGGGSISNCELRYVNDGFYFQYLSTDARTAVGNDNYVHHINYVGALFAGNGLSATASNNVIDLTGIQGGMGFIAGYGGNGNVASFTASNNKIINSGNFGILVGSIQVAQINNNSLTRIAGSFIQNNHSVNVNATCNWYGTRLAATIAPQITGNVTYSPWLADGTDNSTDFGFQTSATCPVANSYYVNDNNRTDDVFTTAVGNNVNAGTFNAPYATVAYAITQVPVGATIYVDAGTFTEQVTIEKGVTIIGAGQNLTSILKPAITVAPPGAFMEQGVIQTAQSITGDVHISNLSVTGGLNPGVTPIIIQSGGSVRNCTLQSGNQGIFVRIDPTINLATKTFVVDGNTINAEFIAVNFAGPRLTATLTNNTIAAFNPGFSNGVFAGVDFGELSGLTVTGNSFSNYVNDGILVRANNGTISQNSFTGTGLKAINKIGGNTTTATCNWYGSADVNVLASKITPGVTFSPWLVDGTDNSSAIGFQPLPNVCTGRQTRFYVNNNTSATRIFTTAAGSDANPGVSSAPFATISAAYQRAQTGDSLFIDAGTYSPGDGTIGKSITLVGTNYLTSPNDATNPLNANSSRVAETIISNLTWTIGANDIRVKGFTFDPQSKAALIQTNNTLDFDNVEISKNILLARSTVAVVNLTGKHQSPLVTTNYVINDNRFVKESGGSGNNISINAIDAVQINNNVFTTNNTIVNNARIQNSINVGGLAGDIVISNNNAYQQNIFVIGNSAKKTTISFNTVDECNRFAFAISDNVNPNEVEITDNVVTNPRSTGSPVISYVRNSGTNLSSPNIARIERNTITLNGTGLTAVAQSLIAPTIDAASANTQVYIRDNKLSITGDFSTLSNPAGYVSAIRFLTSSRYALVENNEIEFTATNYNSATKFGIGILTSILQPGASFNFLNNKFTGYPTSVAVQHGVGGNEFGGLPAGVSVNINNNSFTGDVLSINNGTQSQSVNASCNWYGSAAAQDFINKITLPTVDVEPWLTNGTDADPASTGFQPLPGVCNGTPVVATLISQTNIRCFGGNNGSADVGISGGVLPYTTTWSREGDAGFSQNGEDLLNALAGNYTLLITDAVGATATVQVSLQEPLQLVGLVSGTNVTCFGAADGTATIEVNGGVLPYTYLWSNGAETAGISSLSPGIYSITVTDANGCTVGGSYTVIQPAAVNPAISVTNISCAGAANGQIALTGRAGVAPYMFSLDGIAYQESNVFASLTAGNYTGYVMDANGCVGTVSATISEPLPLEVVLTSVTGTCTGISNGAIDVTVSGGTTRYGFAWTGPNNFTSTREDLTKVVAGTYTLVVTDANGCIANLMVVVGETPALVITGNVIPVSCFGTLTGAIDVSVTGGSGSGYTYVWSGPNGYKASTEDVSGLRAGSYTLTVTDAGGCSGSKVYTVTQPAIALSVTATKDDIIACDALGSITATAAGGTAPYQYSLNGGALQSGNIFPNLPVGSYSIQATDTKGCTTAPLSVSIADNGADAYESNNTATAPININVGSTIRARLAAAKGTDVDWYRFTTTATGSYSVSWNHPLVSQTFDLYVLNKNKAELVPLTSMVGNTKSYTNLSPNTYLVQVSGTQSLICYDLAVNSLSVPPLITSAPAFGNQARTIIPEEQHLSATAFPNPHRGSFTLRIESPEEGVGTVDMYTVNGQWLSERKVNLGKGKANQVQYSNMKHAVLFYRVRIGKHVVTGKVIGGN